MNAKRKTRRSSTGERRIGGKFFILAARGSKASCESAAEMLRRQWKYVRVVPAAPFSSKEYRAVVDDCMVYVFEARQ